MVVKVWEKSDTPDTYVDAVYDRVAQHLPVLNGLSVTDVEADPFFGKSRDALMKITNSRHFPNAIQCSCDILDEINKNDKYAPLIERKKLSLRSIAIILRLLSDLCEANWKSKEPAPVRYLKRPVATNALTSVSGIGSASHRLNYYTSVPDPIPAEIAKRALSAITRLKSAKETLIRIAEIQGKPFKEKPAPHQILLDNIDINCASIIRFISASNPLETLNFMASKMSVLFSQSSEESDYVPYLDFLSHIQVVDEWLARYAELVLKSIDRIRKPIHLQMVLSFSSQSIRFWLMSTPENYLKNISRESSLPLLANSLFEALCSKLPNFLTAGATSVFACLLLVLAPGTFEEYMNELSSPPLKSRNPVGSAKQLQFLKSIVKQSSRNGSLTTEYVNCMVTIMLLAGSVKSYDPNSAIFRFSALHADNIFDTLSMSDPTKYFIGANQALIDSLRVDFFVASIILLEQQYTEKYTKMIKDPKASLPTVRILTSGLKAASTNPAAKSVFNDILTACSDNLRELLIKSCELLRTDDFEQANSPTTSSSVDKVKTDPLALTETDSKSTVASDQSGSTKSSFHRQQSQEKAPMPSLKSTKKDSMSSFRINRHKLDVKKHMSFKNNNSSSNSNSSNSNSLLSSSTPTNSSSSPSTPHHSSNNVTSNTTSSNMSRAQFTYANVSDSLPGYYRDIVRNLFTVFRFRPIAYLLPANFDVEQLNSIFQNHTLVCELRISLEAVIAPYVFLYAEEDIEMTEALTQFTFGVVERLSKAPSHGLALFYNLACFTIAKCLAELITEYVLEDAKINKLLGILVLLMESRHSAVNEIGKTCGAKTQELDHDPEICRISYVSLEMALMSGFLIPDIDTFRLLKRAIKLLLVDSTKHHVPECLTGLNIEFYKSIADDNSTITSLTAVQKKIKRLFFGRVYATTGMTKFWFDIYDKWLSDKSEEKNPHLGYIVSMSGVFIQPDNKDDNVRQSVVEKVNFIITNQMDLLTADDFKIREAAKEIFSTEMSPICYKFVVNHMKWRTDKILEAGNPTDKDFLLIDQFMLILRPIAQADVSYTYLSMPDIQTVVLTWVQIIELAKDEGVKLKLKLRHVKFGQTMDVFKTKYANWGALKLRNFLARVYLDWTETALFRSSDAESMPLRVISVGADSSKASKPANSRKVKELEMLAFDVGVECSSALSSLLERLPLETPQAIHAKELKRSRKMIFGNYFTLLYKILDKFNSSGSSNEISLSAKHKISLLVDNAVIGLTNLLDANVDVGFEFALPLLFHEDRKIKLSFLKVFSNIVDKLDIYGDEDEQKNAAIQKIIHTVMEVPALTVAVASACPASDVDSLALTFLNGDSDQLKVLNVLSTLIRAEITTAKNSSEILRSNSVATRMLALFCKKEGFNYLERTLKPVLSRIADLQDNFEVEKLTADDPNAEENVEKFMFYLNEIIKALFDSIDYIPNEFRYLCSVIYEATGKKFPDAKIYAVGAFMFLRLIAPAIVSPDANDIISVNTDRALKRSFIQLAKVLQLMANSSITTIRWPLLLSRMNELTILNVQITRFLQAVSKFHPKQDLIRTENLSTPVDSGFIHNLIYNHLQKIRTVFTSDPSLTLEEIKTTYAILDDALCDAGQPFSLFGYSISDFLNGKEDAENSLYEFMTKTSMKDINFTVRDNIAHETISADGIPTIVLNYACLENTSYEDAELLMFRFFQIASKIWDSQFYLVLDCTGFNGRKDFMIDLFNIFEAYSPSVVTQNLTKMYFYNVSQKFFPHILDSIKFMQAQGYRDTVLFASSFDNNKFGFGMSAATSSLVEDARVTFHEVSLYEPSQNRFVPVTVKIGDEFLQIGFKQPTRFKAFGTMKTVTLTDIYNIQDLSGAEVSNITGVPDEICINNSVDGSQLILISPKKIEIMRTIYFSKSRYNANVQRMKEEVDDENQRLDNWLGELINIDFVGLLSKDEEVRKASYVLLCSLGKSFKLDLGTYFDSSMQVSFPQNNVSFVISNAKLLAENYKEYTYEIVNGFFNAYKHCDEYQCIGAVMYISPFIRYLFAAIENELASRREEKISSLIKKFIEVSTLREAPLVAFHAHIWSQLTLQDSVSDILIEEAVAAAIDREAEGKPWDDIISLVTLTPTLKICSSVIKRLKELSNISKANSGSSIASHTSWIEITVLVKICVALFFDSILFTEMFIPDIFYISTIFMDVGPFELRSSLYKLLLNVFHSALAKQDLDPENRQKASLIVNRFHDQRIKMLLGLNREEHRTNLIESDGDIFNRISALEMLCDALFEFIHLVGDAEVVNVWRSRWHSLAVDAAFRYDSMLQDRAFLILGFLSKHGVTNKLIERILQAMLVFGDGITDKKSLNTVLCSIYAISRAVQGIPPRSPYSEMLYWLAITMNYNNHILFAHASVQLLGNALVSVDKRGKFVNGDVINRIFHMRKIFPDTIEKYESRFGIHMTPANIDLVIISIFVRDLQAPFTKAVAFDALSNSFRVRVNNALLREKLTNTPSDRRCFVCGVILFVVSRSNIEFIEAISKTDLDVTDMVELEHGIVVPTRMIEFLISGSDHAILTMMKAAIFVKCDSADERSKLRYFTLYRYLSERSDRLKWLLYPEIRSTIRDLSSVTSSPDLASLVFEIAKDAIVCPQYNDMPQHVAEMDRLVAEYELQGARDMQFVSNHVFQLDIAQNISPDSAAIGSKLIKELISRILSAVVTDD